MNVSASHAGPEECRDLAAMIVPLGRALVAAELPVLRAHNLSMWAYVVLLGLGEKPVHTQAALAAAIGADKSRIISVLDDLQSRGLIRRQPDPTDRRRRVIALTPAGRRARESAQAGIRASEERLLARLPRGTRQGFLSALESLSSLSTEELARD